MPPLKALSCILVLTIASVLSACGGSGEQAPLETRERRASTIVQSDTRVFQGGVDNYAIVKTANGYSVTDKLGVEGITNVAATARLRFADVSVALEGDTIAGQAYRIYKAAFNRAPDSAGLGYWIGMMDRGMSLSTVAAGFVDSAEFKSAYGAAPTNRQIVNNLYQNVLGRVGDPGGIVFWVGVLDQGNATVASVLASFSESAENKAALQDTIQSGIAYAEFGLSYPQKAIPPINSVTGKIPTILSSALVISPAASATVPDPAVPGNVAAAPAEMNLKLWIYDPRNPTVALGSPGIFIRKDGGGFQFVSASPDGTLNRVLSPGAYDFDVLEANGTSNIFVRARYSAQVAASFNQIAPSTAKPVIPASVGAPPAGSTLKLWIYDPQNPSVSAGAAGIFLQAKGGAFSFNAVAADGSLYLPLAPGDYVFETVMPNDDNSSRLSYSVTVSASGVASIAGASADVRGIIPVTVAIAPLGGAVSIRGHVPNANGVYSLTADVIAVPTTLGQQKRDALIASAKESAANFQPSSACQLKDQVTPVRTIDGIGLSAGFPKVGWRLPSYGHIRALIVPVDFSDQNGVDDPAQFFTPLADNVRDFYLKQSYGRLSFDFEIVPNWVRVPFTSKDFGYGGTVGSGDPGSYTKDILRLTEKLIDYSQYDAVYFLVPQQMPLEKMGWGPAITHPYWINTGYVTNGATGGADMYFNEQNGVVGAQWKWMAHETGHALGLYDEDLDHRSATLGSWGLMADSWSNGAIEHNGWDRYLQGWLSPSQVACLPKTHLAAAGTSVKLSPLVRQNTDIKVAMVPLSASKILVMESRKTEGYDTMQPGEQGVLVYTVDMSIGHLQGGYVTRPRPGSTDRTRFTDAALRAGDSVTIDGVVVTVVELDSSGDTIRIGVR